MVPTRSTFMKKFKKMIALATLMALTLSSANVQAQPIEYTASGVDGYGYSESRTSPALAPAIALGTIALVAIIAVAVQNSHGGHGHGHSHSN